MAQKKQSFESSMTRLEEIVALLEGGQAPLEQSLSLFEEGAGLLKQCATLLDDAEQKVLLLTAGKDGMPVTSPFNEVEYESNI